MVREKIITKVEDSSDSCYVGRVIERPTRFSLSVMATYLLEVENKDTGKKRRSRIGKGGILVCGDGSAPIFYYTYLNSLKFTQEGLEAMASGETIKKRKHFVIPRTEFPN